MDLGEVRYFLSVEFVRSQQGIIMYQIKYALEIIFETRLSAAKPTSTPMDTTTKLTTGEYDRYIKETNQSGDVFTDQGSYEILVGKLLYLIITKPHIAFTVKSLSLFL